MNMKHLKFSLLFTAVLAMIALPALAQRGNDLFYPTRTLTLAPPTQQAGATSVTNLPTDIRMYDGIVAVTIMSYTNGGGTFTATLEQSSTTNITGWGALSGYSIAVPTTIIYTNNVMVSGGSTNMLGTNYWLLPGTPTTPTASTAGFATSYLLSQEMTNTGAITLPAGGATLIGFNAGDQKRYVHIIFTSTGAATTNFCGAVLSGYTHGSVAVTP
jgi:hypothetical protein